MSITVHPLLLVVFLVIAPVGIFGFEYNVTHFNCGNTFLEKAISVLGLALMCPLGSGGIQHCCEASDLCYSEQRERDFCEEVFCGCVTRVVRNTKWCSPEITIVSCSNTQFASSMTAINVITPYTILVTVAVTFLGVWIVALTIRFMYHIF